MSFWHHNMSTVQFTSCCVVSLYVCGIACMLVRQDILHWQQVPGNVSHYSIVLPPGEDSDHYEFGIASQSHENWSSGISWADCAFHANSSKFLSISDLYVELNMYYVASTNSCTETMGTVVVFITACTYLIYL